MWCKSCRVTGYTHCAHPDECGNMVTLTAAADSWKSWLDDAPLPETFNSATGGLQDFITALSRALLTARAELDTTQTQLGDWIVRADEANVKVETLDAELARVRADAQAAVALMVERAVAQCTEHDDISHNDFGDGWRMCASSIASAIRALAPADGLAAVKALRVEARENAMQALASMGQAQEAYEAQLKAEAERDRIAAELATSRARETALVEALVEQNELLRSAMQIAKREGVDGNVASTNWDAYYNRVAVSLKRHHDTVNQARATLAQTPTDPGDGWTWNERLGWIGPDGKPADPRRRG